MRFFKILLFFAALTLSAGPLSAQNYGASDTVRAEVTSEQVALMFNKITGQVPNFEAWIGQMPEYTAANEINQMIIAERERKRLEDAYREFDIKANFTVVISTEVSQYSDQIKGFLLPDMNEDLFFTYNFLGEAFAIVPEGIKDYQFIPIPAEEKASFESKLGLQRQVTVEFTLTPQYGDTAAPLEANGEKFWLTLASIAEIRLLGQDDMQSLLWQSSVVPAGPQNELLDLYKAR